MLSGLEARQNESSQRQQSQLCVHVSTARSTLQACSRGREATGPGCADSEPRGHPGCGEGGAASGWREGQVGADLDLETVGEQEGAGSRGTCIVHLLPQSWLRLQRGSEWASGKPAGNVPGVSRCAALRVLSEVVTVTWLCCLTSCGPEAGGGGSRVGSQMACGSSGFQLLRGARGQRSPVHCPVMLVVSINDSCSA